MSQEQLKKMYDSEEKYYAGTNQYQEQCASSRYIGERVSYFKKGSIEIEGGLKASFTEDKITLSSSTLTFQQLDILRVEANHFYDKELTYKKDIERMNKLQVEAAKKFVVQNK